MATDSTEASIPGHDALREALRDVIDPEVGINIVDLGLVYGVTVEDGTVRIDMTMTSPACPMGELLVEDVEAALRAVLPPEVPIAINLVWSPPWDPSMMSEDARRHFDW